MAPDGCSTSTWAGVLGFGPRCASECVASATAELALRPSSVPVTRPGVGIATLDRTGRARECLQLCRWRPRECQT